MKPTFKWRGATDSEAGQAVYEIGGNLETLPMPTYMDAHIIYEMLQQAYDAGHADARAEAKVYLRKIAAKLA